MEITRMARLFSRLPAWLVLAVLIALMDWEWPHASFHALYVVLLLIAWRWLPRRLVPLFTGILFALAALPGFVGLLRGDVPDLTSHLSRAWTACGMAAAGLWFARQQIVRRRRVQMRRQLHARVVRRTVQLRRANRRLLDEMNVRESTERRLVESELHLESLIDHLALHVIRKDQQGIFTYASQSFCELLGRTQEDVIGHKDTEFYPPLSAAKYRQDDLKVMTSRQVIDTIEVNPHPDGSRSYVQVLKAPDINASGDVVGVQAVFWDVTARQHSEVELRRSEARKRALFEAVGDAILLVDPLGRIVEANPSVEEVFRMSLPEVLGRRLREVARPGPAGTDVLWPPQQIGQRTEIELQRGDGGPLAAEVVCHPIPLDDAPGWAIVIRDITQRRAAARALEAAKNAAEAANQAKSRFVAGVSHELRTPLGAMMGVSQLLAETPLNPQQSQYVGLLGQAAEMLNGVIDDLLDFSKMEADRLRLELQPFDLIDAIGSAVKCLGPKAAAKHLRLIVDFATDLPELVVGDSLRLRQVVMNLVGNAIKFTQQGHVLVRVGRSIPATNEQDKVGLVLDVIDTGIGIAEERQAAIFDAFEQADSSTTRRFGGTGLGLAITDRLVRLMAGSIEVISRAGAGSTFRIRLALPAAVPADAAAKIDTSQEARHAPPTAVRLYGFSEPELTAVTHALQRVGYAPRVLEDDAEALPSDESVLLLTPVEARIPEPLDRFDRITVGDASLADHGHRTVGILRPFLPIELDHKIRETRVSKHQDSDLQVRPPTSVVPTSPRTSHSQGNGRGLNVLLADDSPLNRTVIGDLLTTVGHRVTLADDGREALSLAIEQDFDLVLMDLQMPELDGIQAAEQIREMLNQRSRRIPPIIALTAHVTEEYRERCLSAGLTGYVTKPVRRNELLEAIAQAVPDVSRVQAPSTALVSEPSREIASTDDGLNLAPDWLRQLAGKLGLPDSLWIDAAELLQTELVRQQQLLEEGLRQSDWPRVRRAAHTLKTAFGYVEANADRELAATVEHLAEAGDETACAPAAQSLSARVVDWLGRLQPFLESRSSAP